MNPIELRELTDRIVRAVVQDAYDTNDINRLITVALTTNERLVSTLADNARLKEALETAGTHIAKLEAQLDSFGSIPHLVQYQEENAIAAL